MTNPCWVFFASCFLFRFAVVCFVGCERFVWNRNIYLVCPPRAALLTAQATPHESSSLPHWETDSSLSARHWNDPRRLRNMKLVIKCLTPVTGLAGPAVIWAEPFWQYWHYKDGGYQYLRTAGSAWTNNNIIIPLLPTTDSPRDNLISSPRLAHYYRIKQQDQKLLMAGCSRHEPHLSGDCTTGRRKNKRVLS